MPRKFTMVSPDVWRSRRFRALQNDTGKLLYMYLLTNVHQNSAGTYRLPDGYACADLNWTQDQLDAARNALIEADLIMVDGEGEGVYICRWFKHNPPMNPKHAQGTQGIIQSMCDCPEIYQQAMDDFLEAEEGRLNGKTGEPPAQASNGATPLFKDRPDLRTELMQRSGRA